MSKPFEYKNGVSDRFFVGRAEEIGRLQADFMFLTNALVTAPQGWGKTSLLRKAAETACSKDSRLRVCHVSLSNIRDSEPMFIRLAGSVIRAVSSSVDEAVSCMNRYMPGMDPVMNFGSGSLSELTVDMDRAMVRGNEDLFMKMPEKVAADKGLKIVICIDDFHYVDMFPDSDRVVEVLGKGMNGNKCSSFCLSGCRTAFMDSFVKKVAAFYRYGDIIRLGPVSASEFVGYIRDTFADSGKYIDDEMAGMIIDKACGHPFYIQQLAHASWLRTSVVCPRETVEEAFESMTDQMSMVFRNMTEGMTSQQLCYLHAVLSGEKVISSSEVLHRHRISSATSASRSKSSLLEKGILVMTDGKVSFADPLYAYWLEHRYFN